MKIEQELFAGDRFRAFLEEHFLKTPISVARGCISLVGLGSWNTLAMVLANESADIIVGAGGAQAEAIPPRSLLTARAILDAGWTIGVRHAERCNAELGELAKSFRATFRSEVDVQLYCTPGGHRGFGWHYDAEDVFVLQTVGQKTWWLRKNTVNPWPTMETLPADMHYEREIMPTMRCPLHAGDWLYIPGGYWHRTEATETSISLSVGILPATALDLFDFLRRELAASLLWRQRLPMHASYKASNSEYGAMLKSLARDIAARLADRNFISAFIDSRPR